MPQKDKAKKTKNTKTLILLDAHAIIHRAYHALPEFMSSDGAPTGALYGLSNMLMKIITDLKPDYIVACYDLPQKTFRHEAYDAYKAGRKKTDDALVSQLISSRDIFEGFNIPMYDAPGFEADDILGTIAEKYKGNKSVKIIIASGDMDTMQLVDDKKVQVYTLKKGINDTILYDEEKVIERFHFKPKFLPDYKGLRGDPSDNIIGIKGIGEKTAETLIVSFGTIEEIYKKLKKPARPDGRSGGDEAFLKAGISPRMIELLKDNEEEALFSKTLATIRTDAPIQFSLPEKTFWENADLKKIEKVFMQYEFRSLFTRLKSFFTSGQGSEEYARQNSHPVLEGQDYSGSSKDSFEHIPPNPLKLQEASIALWLINSEMANPKLEDVLMYAKTASFDTAYEYVFKKLEEKNLGEVYSEIERPLMHTIEEMHKHGILIDKKYFENLSKEYHIELDKLTKKIYKMAGEEFNINSPKQLGEILFGKLGMKSKKKAGASGSFSTKVSVLEELEDENEIIGEIMAYRELQKLLSTYIDVIPNMVGEDGRLHAKFIQNGSSTGRFSSQDPNLQNLPIKTELGKRIRGGFIAQKDHKLVAFDYSQIELRVVAMLSGDEKMTEVFRDKKDIHTGTAAFVFGVPMDKVDSEMRRKAKVINFGIIYGMGVTALRKNLGGTREEAQKFYDNYFNQFSGVRDYLNGVKEFAVKHSYTETLFGRKRTFANINSRIPFLKNMAERTAINAPVQGTAADVIKLAIRFAEEDLKKEGLKNQVHLMLQIHDELVYEIHESVLAKASKIIKDAMEGVLLRSYIHYKTDIPLEIQYYSGNNFGELK
ncbi:MAG TPA: DNA polymerase [Candidatus Paceibacterota bacterium]|jgi:DNA polymerase-1|nr:DNA polymerase [Candidatus Paceibacterota bacterium]